MKISKKSQYGLRAMAYLADKNDMCSLKEICQAEDMPFDYLEKIISKLKNAGFLKVKRGAKGGYFLARPPKEVKVGQIIKALEGTMAPVFCIASEKEKKYFCPREKICPTRIVWKKIQDILNSTLDSITLKDLTKGQKIK
jgi:Rrf2 family protein